MSIAQGSEGFFALRRAAKAFVWDHPEWWVIAGALFAWAILIVSSASGSSPDFICSLTPRGMEKSNDLLSGAPGISFWVAEMFGWLIMSAAMMLPLTIAPVRHVAFRSLWKRRHRAVFCFLLGVALIWTAVGLLWIAILGLHGASAFGTVASSLVIAVAAGWQFTPAKRRALLACHRTVPLAVDRWRADLDCLRYGLLHGRHCLLSCWALMLAAMLLHPGLPAMFGASVVALTERYRPQRLRTASLLALGLAVFALISQQA